MNKNGQAIMINLLFMFMGIVFLVAFIGPIDDQIDLASNVDGLNCKGYVDYDATATSNKSYNSTVGEKSSLACTAIDLFLPYIVLAALVGLVTKLLYGQTFGRPQQEQYGGY